MPVLLENVRSIHGMTPTEGPTRLYLGDDGRLAEVPSAPPEGTRVVDARGLLALPGLVIAHHHLYSALARGMPGAPGAPPANFVEILEKVWWRLDRCLDGDSIEASGLVGMTEALRCGVTTLIDHHASPRHILGSLDRLASGITRAGGRAALCYECTDRNGEGGFDEGLDENRRWLELDRPTTLAAMVGGHAPFTLSDAHLAAMSELAKAHDAFVHLHVAESDTDQVDAKKRGNIDVTERLVNAGLLEGRALFAHGVHLTDAELEQWRDANGVWLTHQPRSNMNNHVGYLSRARRFPRLALGTDGINGDLLAEVQAAFFRLKDHDRDAVAETVWGWMASSWHLASLAFGLSPEAGFGHLLPGAPADLVLFEDDYGTPISAGSLPWHLVFGMSSRQVRHVFVEGRQVVEDGQPTGVPAAAVRAEGVASATRLWAKMAELG